MNSSLRTHMRSLLVDESFAYGFTIAFWGSGLLLVNEFGTLHTTGILEYATGAITGFGVLALASFGGPVETVRVESEPSYHVLAGVHYLAALVPIAATHFVVVSSLGRDVSLFLTGMVVPVGFNVFALLQELVSKAVLRVEGP